MIRWEPGRLGTEKAWAAKRSLSPPETAGADYSYFIVAERCARFPLSTRGGDVGFLPLANQDLILFSRRASVSSTINATLSRHDSLPHRTAPVESAVVTQPNSALSASAHVNQVIELLRKLMEYRNSDVRLRLEKVGQAASMLHMDVLLLIYHFASSAREMSLRLVLMSEDRRLPQRMARARIQCAEKIASIEAGGKLKHFRLSSSHIIKDLKKNLARFGVVGRCYADQWALLRRSNHTRSSSGHGWWRSRALYFRCGQQCATRPGLLQRFTRRSLLGHNR